MRRCDNQTVNFSANDISLILLLTNERVRKVVANDSVRLNEIQFVIVKNKLMSVFCLCPLIDDGFCHNIVKIAVALHLVDPQLF